jgi:hypothetical protein
VAICASLIIGGEELLSQLGRKGILAHAASRNVSAGGTGWPRQRSKAAA